MVAVLVDEPRSSEALAPDAEARPPESLSAAELERDVVEGYAKQASNFAWWLSRVAEFDRRELFVHLGVNSCSHWLTLRCGISSRTAREHVKVARQLDDLPAVRTAFSEGRVSYSKVRAVCRVATPATEAFLLDLAFSLTTPQLERSIMAYEAAHRRNTAEDDMARRERCGIHRSVDHDGLVRYEMIVEPQESLLMDKAMEYGCDQVYDTQKRAARAAAEAAERGEEDSGEGADGAGDGPPIAKPSYPRGPKGRLEGLLWSVRRGLVNFNRPEAVFAEPYQIVVHVKEGAAFVDHEGNVDLGNGLTVHPKTLQKMACASMITAMLEGSDERPLDLGRTKRVATRKQKIALSARYPTCQFPGCEIGWQRCEFHHLDFWARDKGSTDLERMRPLCGAHHDLVHIGGWQLVLDHRGRVMAVTPGGSIVPPVPVLSDIAVGPQLLVDDVLGRGYDDSRRAAHERAETLMGASHGERLTRWGLGVIVEGLLWTLDGPEAVFDPRTLWPNTDDEDEDDEVYVDGIRVGVTDEEFEEAEGDDEFDLAGSDPPTYG